MTNGPKSHERRHLIAARDGWRCNFCRQVTECATCNPAADLLATLDHIIPRSQGGTDAFVNLCIACQPCNEAKGSGIWPSPGERNRVVLARQGGGQPGWLRKRLGEPGVVHVQCWPKDDRRRRPSKAYATAEDAAKAVESILESTGKVLVAAQCRRCKRWHIGPPHRAAQERESA